MKKLLDGAVIRAAIDGETGYLFANDKLIGFDLKTSSTREICSLNFYPSYSYDYIQVNRIKDGKLYFGIFGISLNQYVIELNSGVIKEII